MRVGAGTATRDLDPQATPFPRQHFGGVEQCAAGACSALASLDHEALDSQPPPGSFQKLDRVHRDAADYPPTAIGNENPARRIGQPVRQPLAHLSTTDRIAKFGEQHGQPLRVLLAGRPNSDVGAHTRSAGEGVGIRAGALVSVQGADGRYLLGG